MLIKIKKSLFDYRKSWQMLDWYMDTQ
jgi:hypothetical protein